MQKHWLAIKISVSAQRVILVNLQFSSTSTAGFAPNQVGDVIHNYHQDPGQLLGHFFVGVANRICLANLCWIILVTWFNHRSWGLNQIYTAS